MQSIHGLRLRDDAKNRDTTASIAATSDMYIPSEPLAPETSMRRVATWLFLSLFSMPPLLARSPQFVTFPSERLDVEASEVDGGGSEVYGATALGDFDGDRVADAFVLRGSTLIHVNDLVLDGVATIVGPGFTDAATLRGGIANRDGCVTAGDDGLRLWHFDEALAYTAADNATAITSQLLAAGGWIDAAAVCCGDVDGDGRDDVVGLAASRLSILTMLATSTGVFVPGPTIAVAHPAYSIALVATSLGGPQRIAVSTMSGVTLHDPIAVPITSVPSPLGAYEYPQMSRYHAPGLGDRLVAMTRVYAPAGQGIYVASTSSVEADALLAPEFDCVSLAPFDADLDGDMDLAMNARALREIGIMLQDPTRSPPFDANDISRWWIVAPGDSLSGPDPGRAARLAAADLDGDGDFDMVHGDDPTASITVLRNTIRAHGPQQPALTSLHFVSIDPSGQLRLLGFFEPQAGYDPLATHLEITVHHQPDPQLPADPDAIVHQITPIAPPESVFVPLTLPETATPFPDHYWLAFRYVRMQNGSLIAGAPPMTYRLDISGAVESAKHSDSGLPILSNGVIPQPGGAKGVFAKPTAKPAPVTVNPQ
jgi:hypothetical protein